MYAGPVAPGYNYVYQYKDNWGNVRMNYAYIKPIKAGLGSIFIKDESHYYPFGLKHTNYNVDYLEFQQIDDDIILYPPITTTGKLPYNYKYQEQERQDELGLNWDSFRHRNYDYAIGRFMSINPLAIDYEYNSPYAFQENKMGMGRELEGLELKKFTEDAYVNTEIKHAVDWFAAQFESAKPQKLEKTSNEDLSATSTSKKGGNENPKTTGKTGGNIDAGAIVDATQGGAKSGNKYKSTKDILTYTKDLISADKKVTKAKKAVENVIQKNGNAGAKIDTPKRDSVDVYTYEKGKLTKVERKAVKDGE